VIGVVARPEQAPLLREFFQLFKTPWEIWNPQRTYDAVVVTADDAPDITARLVVIYGARRSPIDEAAGIYRSSRRTGRLTYRGHTLPIYGDLATFEPHGSDTAIATTEGGVAGVRLDAPHCTIVRFGYDPFEELGLLLSNGQPVEWAHVPTLDLHIRMMRDALVEAGIQFVEIPPAPAGYRFAVTLTHDIDFVAARDHLFDHTMWGFLYRSTIGAAANLWRRRTSVRRLLKIWWSAAKLPFVHLGWATDFWAPFAWYLHHEKGLPATYFLIPFKRRPGQRVPGRRGARRATAYDIGDLPEWTRTLTSAGCELGVHGIDAWHDAGCGREELARVAAVTGQKKVGTRIHWLLQDGNTPRVLEEAGYAYDSTAGYNETIGYRNGTAQVFRPLTAQSLLELPLHIQDGALFFPQRLDLSESEAWRRCTDLIDTTQALGGVVTLLWHDRSHGPERFWGDFYVRLIEQLKTRPAWFATAIQAVEWFRTRRDVRFEMTQADGDGRLRVSLPAESEGVAPSLTVRVYNPRRHRSDAGRPFEDFSWNGANPIELAMSAAWRAA
jgi:hypothetical protein